MGQVDPSTPATDPTEEAADSGRLPVCTEGPWLGVATLRLAGARAACVAALVLVPHVFGLDGFALLRGGATLFSLCLVLTLVERALHQADPLLRPQHQSTQALLLPLLILALLAGGFVSAGGHAALAYGFSPAVARAGSSVFEPHVMVWLATASFSLSVLTSLRVAGRPLRTQLVALGVLAAGGQAIQAGVSFSPSLRDLAQSVFADSAGWVFGLHLGDRVAVAWRTLDAQQAAADEATPQDEASPQDESGSASQGEDAPADEAPPPRPDTP